MRLLSTKTITTSVLNSQTAEGRLVTIDDPKRLPVGFPILLDSAGKLHWGVFSFLLDLYRLDSTRDRRKTLQTYAESLKCWLEFLQEVDQDWTRPAPWMISEFRSVISNGESGRRPVSNATVNLRTAVVKEFYAFLLVWRDSGHPIARSEIEVEPVRRFLTVARKLRPAKAYRKRPRSLTKMEVASIAGVLSPVYSLIFRWTISTGMRRTTAVGLTMSQLPPVANDLNYMRVKVKGGKEIEVPVAASLLRATNEYIASLRDIYLGRSGDKTLQVFINERGLPVSSRGYYQAFRRAVQSLGIQASPHSSRHTFAVHMKAALEKLADGGAAINPGKVLQQILGHSSARTTEIYLGSVSAVNAGVLRALVEVDGIVA